MAFHSKRKAGNDKYLRLTGLWPSKKNDKLLTGRLKAENVEDLLKRCEEAIEAEAPIVFSLWENVEKASQKDPDFSLQCFVGDSEEKPVERSSRRNRKEVEEGDEKPTSKTSSKRKHSSSDW